MPSNVTLVKIADNEFDCSGCGDFKVELREHSESLWRLIEADFADHVRRRHSSDSDSKVNE